MNNPYVNTILTSAISLRPDQMNNNIDSHLKANLKNMLEGKCYRNFGYIVNIYKLTKKESGKIEQEDSSGSAIFNITFECKLCMPLKNMKIVCVVNESNIGMLMLSNGPIRVILGIGRINPDEFTITKYGIFAKTSEGNKLLRKGDHVIVKIDNVKHQNMDTVMLCSGHLLGMASDEDIENFAQSEFKDDGKFVDYKYIIDKYEKDNDLTQIGNKMVKENNDQQVVETEIDMIQ
jgi:DNA-directed RNA polymerase subunit E'/Rpb7